MTKVPYTDRLPDDLQISMEESIAAAIFANPSVETSEEVAADLSRDILYSVLRGCRPDLFEDAPPAAVHETQQSIGRWIDATFPGADPASPRKALRALEELVELCLVSGASAQDVVGTVSRQLIKEGMAPRTPEWIARVCRPDKIPKETADVAIVLMGYAQLKGFSLQAEIDAKMAINRARTWHANGDGTGYHVKPGAAPE